MKPERESLLRIFILLIILVNARMKQNKGLEIEGEEPDPTSQPVLVLLALAQAADFCLKAHVPRHAILSKFRKDKRGLAKEYLEKITKKGWAQRHPTRGENTWQLTERGLRASTLLAQYIDRS